jgi:hypothetical protein
MRDVHKLLLEEEDESSSKLSSGCPVSCSEEWWYGGMPGGIEGFLLAGEERRKPVTGYCP